MKKILIIGASSLIAMSAARIWAQRGDELFIVGRDKERLNVMSKDLILRGSPNVQNYCMDMNQYDLHLPMLNKAFQSLTKIDIVLIAHGTLANQKKCQQSAEMTLEEINTNALSTIVALTHLANFFEIQKGGTIAVITSVAGDRGRANNYVYGSAKAMVTAFASGLRQRLYASSVSVVTIKPGLVDTPMTADFKKGLLWASPKNIGKTIVNACDYKNGEVYAPYFWYWIMLIIKIIPTFIYKKINL